MNNQTPLRGTRVSLTVAGRGHAATYRRWFNDFPVQRTSGLLPMPWSEQQFSEWFERRVLQTSDAVWFTVLEIGTERPVGFTGVRDIDHHHRTAEYFITIGEANARGKGLGTEAAILTLDFAFTVLNLHNVFLNVSSASLAGIRAYEKAGFREIGRRTESLKMGGRLYDWVYMECLSTEFQSPVRQAQERGGEE
jgi:diamine N-acetyltransferase